MKNGRCILIALVAGCGAADTTDTERAPLPPSESDRPSAVEKSETTPDLDCPLALPGAQVASEVTPDGVALVFTVNSGDPGELRARVRRMAENHNQREVVPTGDAATAGGDTGMTSTEGARGVDMHGGAARVPSRAAVEDTSNGARVVFTPANPAQVGILREQIRVHGEELASTGCGGNEPAPTQAPPPPPSSGDRMPPLEPTPTPNPQEPILPDRPVTPDQPVTPPSAPPPPTGQPFRP